MTYFPISTNGSLFPCLPSPITDRHRLMFDGKYRTKELLALPVLYSKPHLHQRVSVISWWDNAGDRRLRCWSTGARLVQRKGHNAPMAADNATFALGGDLWLISMRIGGVVGRSGCEAAGHLHPPRALDVIVTDIGWRAGASLVDVPWTGPFPISQVPVVRFRRQLSD